MNIGFDSVGILGPASKNRGIGNYTKSQFLKMAEIDQENQYFFLNTYEADFSLSEFMEDASNLHEEFYFFGKGNFLLHDRINYELVGKVVKRFLKDNQIDVFYMTSPFDENMTLYRKEWFEGVTVVATVYDIIPYMRKEQYFPRFSRAKQYYEMRIDMLKWVDQILVISESVKQDMIKYMNFAPEKIDVIWGAVDERFKEIPVADETEKEIREKFGITDSFIICTGGADGRKNLDGLIRAFGAMPTELKEQYQLVIVCKLSQETVDGFMKLAKESDADGRVICTNFVTDEELLILYNLAHLTAFPSKYEGFGLPVVESWACGTPVLTSNNSSLVEVGGDGAVLVNPNDVSDITRGLVQALSETDLEELLQKGKKRLERFQWKVVAEDTLKFIQDAYEKHEKTNQDLTKEEKPEEIYADKKWLSRLYAERIIGQKYTSLEIWHLARMIAYADGVDKD